MDVKTTFLNGDLDETVCMDQLKRFIEEGAENNVYKSEKTFYGLKQTSRKWNLKFHESIVNFGFVQNSEEPCVYIKKDCEMWMMFF